VILIHNNNNNNPFFLIKTLSDVRDFSMAKDVVKKVLHTYGRLDILINGAAGNFLCASEDLSSNAFKTSRFRFLLRMKDSFFFF
jgi:NAD(P)-dependent dehydrogenase (short-subunit alcohol dehydrogenase family)